MYKKITTILLVVCLIFIGYTFYDNWIEAKEELSSDINEFNRVQHDIWYGLQKAEHFLMKYPLDGVDTDEQKAFVKGLNQEMTQINMQMRYGRLPFSSYTYENGIDEIFRELDIYVNRFDTERYPANEENMIYMNNLLLLIQELRISFDENIGLLEMAQIKQDVSYLETFMELQIPIFEKNTWVIEPVRQESQETLDF